MDQGALFSISYAGPIYYYSLITRNNSVSIEQFENFPKQSIRNRCEIYGANGIICLSIPVIRGRSHKVKIRDLKISYDTDWQKQHFKSIESAYRHSPFYEHYIDIFKEFYLSKFKFLWDFDLLMMEKIINELGLDTKMNLTKEFYQGDQNKNDYRYAGFDMESPLIKPLSFPGYYQVFSDKYGFLPNLSIIDLIFNIGPDSREYLLNKEL